MLSRRLGEWFGLLGKHRRPDSRVLLEPTLFVLAAKRSAEAVLKKILLVDNNHEYRHVLASIVRRAGYEVLHAAKVADAVKRLVSDRPDLIMVGDGVEIAGLKSNQFSVRIPMIIYGAQQTSSRPEEALSKGAADILTKRISSADVSEVLGKHLQTSQNRPRPIPSPRVA
ncbi:MAG TPA: response regulator [Candidatus Binatia bacterium]